MNNGHVPEGKVTAVPVYTVEDGDIALDRQAAMDIWRGNLGPDEVVGERYDSIANSPFGPPTLKFLRHVPSGQRVGIGLLGPRRMLWKNREIRAGVLAHFAVVPEHRSLGPALMLQIALLESSRNRFDLVYGIPQQGAGAVFKRLGYSVMGDLVRYVKVTRHAHYLQRKMPRIAARVAGPLVDCAFRMRDLFSSPATGMFTSEWRVGVDPRMDELWSDSRAGDALTSIRDTRMLRWRLDEAPIPATRYLVISNKDDNRLVAWFACETDQKMPTSLRVTDFWSSGSALAMEREYVDILASCARRQGYASVSLEFAGSPTKLAPWLAARFIERSRSQVFGRWHDPDLHANGPTDLHLTALDNDG